MSRASDLANVIASGSTDIVAEGTATTNLQQGLAKVWITFVAQGDATTEDSLNVSSIVDNSQVTINIANNMNNAVYPITFGFQEGGNTNVNVIRVDSGAVPTTGVIVTQAGEFQAGATNVERTLDYGYTVVHGDLA